MKTYARAALWVILVASIAPASLAAVPLLMPTQGVIRDNAGQPVVGESFEMTFAIYADEADGDAVWLETWPPGGADCVAQPAGCVAVTSGVFSVLLGTHVALDPTLFRTHSGLWLGVSVEGEPELPRRALASAAFAIHAQSAEISSGVDCVGCIGAEALSPEVAQAIATPTPDTLDEVSNGTLTNEFERTHPASGLPVTLGLSEDLQIAVDQSGTVLDLAVSLELTHASVSDLEVRLLGPGDAVGVLLVAAGDESESPVSLYYDVESELPSGESLGSMVGQPQQGVWTLRVTDTIDNGNEHEGIVSAASLTLRYLASAEVGIKMPDGSIQLVGPEQNETLTTLVDQVASLQAELWCLKNCDVDQISDCVDRSCDGAEQSCTPIGPLGDGTSCLGGVGTCVAGTCCVPGTCATLDAECGTIDDSCGTVLTCGTCDASYACVDNTCMALGTHATVPAESCAHIKALGLESPDGLYWVTLDGQPTQVYCDMTIAEGGWTLAMQISTAADGTFGYQSEHWTTSALLNDTPPVALTQIDAKYATYNSHVAASGLILLVDKETGLHSELQVPGLQGNTLLSQINALGKTNLILLSGQPSPQELMGYDAPTAMCSGPATKWMLNALSVFAGVRIGNDVASNDEAVNHASSWPCWNAQGLNLSYSGLGGTLESNRAWQDGYGSEALDQWRSTGGTGRGTHHGVALFVK